MTYPSEFAQWQDELNRPYRRPLTARVAIPLLLLAVLAGCVAAVAFYLLGRI